jgi:hypothetical protein
LKRGAVVTGDCMGLWGQETEHNAEHRSCTPGKKRRGLVHVSSAEEGLCEWMPWRHGAPCSRAVGLIAVCSIICIYQYAADFAPHGDKGARTKRCSPVSITLARQASILYAWRT